MWWSQKGMRVLKDAEAAVFRDALASLWDENKLCDKLGDGFGIGVTVFDQLKVHQKLAVLVEVGEALLFENVPAPELTALNEGVISSVYRQLQCCLENELDQGATETYFRSLTQQACRQVGAEDIPDVDCDDTEEWQFLTEILEYQILWDSDHENTDLLDEPPADRKRLGTIMGISEDYYTAIAPDPGPQDIEILSERLRILLQAAK